MNNKFSPETYFDLTVFEHRTIFDGIENVWDVLPRIAEYLAANLRPGIFGTVHPGAHLVGDDIFIAEGAIVEPGAYIAGPAIIGAGTVVRHGAYIRGKVIAGRNCVIGHTTEVKNAIFMDDAKAGHFAYVGDSVLGHRVNLGAGTKLANFKLRGTEIRVRHGDTVISTGLRKFGAILGDDVSLGCNTVCNPGTLLGKGVGSVGVSLISGVHPAGELIK